jgi:[ribosomal protein S18]-alanine N-acetyltransferase
VHSRSARPQVRNQEDSGLTRPEAPLYRLMSAQPMLIRPATPADIPAMLALEQQAHTAAHWREREYQALFTPDAPQRIALIAEAGPGEIRGFAIARCGTGEWEIENIVVSPQHRRRGIGSALVRQVLKTARDAGARPVLLEVRESNTAARQLYGRLGFAETGRRPAYYSDPVEDALLLRFSADVFVRKPLEAE